MSYRYLTFQDRKVLSKLYLEEVPIREIAERIGVHKATIYNELMRGYTGREDKNRRPEYDPTLGQREVAKSFQRKGNRKNEPEIDG